MSALNKMAPAQFLDHGFDPVHDVDAALPAVTRVAVVWTGTVCVDVDPVTGGMVRSSAEFLNYLDSTEGFGVLGSLGCGVRASAG